MLKVAKLPKTGDEKASFTAWTSSLVPVGLKGTSGPESPQAVRATHAAAIRVTERLVHCRTRIGRASVSWAGGRPYRRASVGKYLGGWTLRSAESRLQSWFRPAAGGGEGNGYAKVCSQLRVASRELPGDRSAHTQNQRPVQTDGPADEGDVLGDWRLTPSSLSPPPAAPHFSTLPSHLPT